MARVTIANPEARKLRKDLTDLTRAVHTFLVALDEEMTKPSSIERGKRIARLASALEMANDQARYFGLNVDWRTDKKK